MKTRLIILALAAMGCTQAASAQNAQESDTAVVIDYVPVANIREPIHKIDPDDEIFQTAEVAPSFPGGVKGLMDFIADNMHYPKSAMDAGIQGRVIVSFVVTKTGDIGKVKVVRSVDPDLDAEAVRVVRLLPRFTPGTMNGHPVNVWYLLPLNFRLPER